MYHKHAQSINSGNRESHELKGMSKNYHTPLITKLVNRKRKAKVKVVGNPEMETGEYSCSVKQCTRDKQTGRQKGDNTFLAWPAWMVRILLFCLWVVFRLFWLAHALRDAISFPLFPVLAPPSLNES